MHQEVKQQWVTALRSGEYAQGYGHLRKDDEYCCLGVLCDLAVKAAVTHGRQIGDTFQYGAFGQEQRYYLPADVRDWAELEFRNPTVWRDGNRVYLAELNDKRTPFSEIADLIEQYL